MKETCFEIRFSPGSSAHEQPTPTCPHCGYAMDAEDMLSGLRYRTGGIDLFALAPKEETAEVKCPRCGESYAVQGSYTPHYTSAISEDDL